MKNTATGPQASWAAALRRFERDLRRRGAGIHGTDAVSSLGTAASHGCIRMAIPDVKELYEDVPVGAPVYIA